MIYPLKNVIFNSYVSLPEDTVFGMLLGKPGIQRRHGTARDWLRVAWLQEGKDTICPTFQIANTIKQQTYVSKG